MSDSAPGPLGLVQAFVNTLEVDEGRDDLADPAGLEAWLADRGFDAAAPPAAAEVAEAIAVREALRALLLANNGGRAATADDFATLNRAAGRHPVTVRFDAPGATLELSAGGLEAAVARVLLAAAESMADGSWRRLKACAEGTCRWAFYDQSKNRSGHWCSMRSCGNRAKARQFRARRRSAAVAVVATD